MASSYFACVGEILQYILCVPVADSRDTSKYQIKTISWRSLEVSATSSEKPGSTPVFWFIITARNSSCGKVMFYKGVCQSFCSQGEGRVSGGGDRVSEGGYSGGRVSSWGKDIWGYLYPPGYTLPPETTKVGSRHATGKLSC